MHFMAKKMETVKTGWPIPVKVKESFVDFCDHVKSVAQADCAGALFLWQRMPSRLREWAKLDAHNSPAVPSEFWAGLAAGLDASLQSLLENLPKKPAEKHPKSK